MESLRLRTGTSQGAGKAAARAGAKRGAGAEPWLTSPRFLLHAHQPGPGVLKALPE